jgi:uncharacterized damage-inducible protein DinB
MTDALVRRFRRWFDYEKDAHAKVLASLEAVPNELRGSREYEKALTLMGHIIAARRLWLHRLGLAREAPREFFPQGINLSELAAQADAMHAAWTEYLKTLDDGALERVFEYRSQEGPRFRSSVEDILTQLFGHSSYHRGQIASLIRSIGAEPAVTDFVFWTRELIP